MLAGRILGAMNQFVLQYGEERFGHRIIVADPGPPGGLPETMFPQRIREVPRCVIAAAVRVEIASAARGKLRAAISIACWISGVL